MQQRSSVLLLLSGLAMFVSNPASARPYYVSPAGDDANPGTIARPFATLKRAQMAARHAHGIVYLRGGTYYLNQSILTMTLPNP